MQYCGITARAFILFMCKKTLYFHCTPGITMKRTTSGRAHLRGIAAGQHSFEEMSQRWRAFGHTASDFTVSEIERRPPHQQLCTYNRYTEQSVAHVTFPNLYSIYFLNRRSSTDFRKTSEGQSFSMYLFILTLTRK